MTVCRRGLYDPIFSFVWHSVGIVDKAVSSTDVDDERRVRSGIGGDAAPDGETPGDSGLTAQVGQQFTQPGPFGPGKRRKKQDLRPEGPNIPLVFRLIERNDRPFRPHENFGGIDSRAEGPWLGELLAPWAANHG